MIGVMQSILQNCKKGLGWMPRESFESGILKTIEWYVEKYKDNL